MYTSILILHISLYQWRAIHMCRMCSTQQKLIPSLYIFKVIFIKQKKYLNIMQVLKILSDLLNSYECYCTEMSLHDSSYGQALLIAWTFDFDGCAQTKLHLTCLNLILTNKLLLQNGCILYRCFLEMNGFLIIRFIISDH